jgi:Glycosyltransferase family 18
VYLLSFFGTSPTSWPGLTLEPSHLLTPFPLAQGTFLGFELKGLWRPRDGQCERFARDGEAPSLVVDACSAQPNSSALPPLPDKSTRRGVVWGKKPEYALGRERWLAAAAALAPLHTTLPASAGLAPLNLVSHGHLDTKEWAELLGSASFFLGLGDPLLGPSALDAVAAGAVFINPVFSAGNVRAELQAWGSQHPYLSGTLGAPYVCDATLDDLAQLTACVQAALDLDLPPLIPKDFTRRELLPRVASIFKRWLE